MTSQITFSKIKHVVVKSSYDLSATEQREGKLQAGEITSKLCNGLIIDVLVLKMLSSTTTDDPITLGEDNIRDGTRRRFLTLSKLFIRKGRIPVHTDFFKKIEDGDTIIIILHEV